MKDYSVSDYLAYLNCRSFDLGTIRGKRDLFKIRYKYNKKKFIKNIVDRLNAIKGSKNGINRMTKLYFILLFIFSDEQYDANVVRFTKGKLNIKTNSKIFNYGADEIYIENNKESSTIRVYMNSDYNKDSICDIYCREDSILLTGQGRYKDLVSNFLYDIVYDMSIRVLSKGEK